MLRIKAYEVIINLDLFPVMFVEGSSIILHGFNKEGVSIDLTSPKLAEVAFMDIIRAIANPSLYSFLDLDERYTFAGVHAYKMNDDAVPPHTKASGSPNPKMN